MRHWQTGNMLSQIHTMFLEQIKLILFDDCWHSGNHHGILSCCQGTTVSRLVLISQDHFPTILLPPCCRLQAFSLFSSPFPKAFLLWSCTNLFIPCSPPRLCMRCKIISLTSSRGPRYFFPSSLLLTVNWRNRLRITKGDKVGKPAKGNKTSLKIHSVNHWLKENSLHFWNQLT